MPTLSLKSPLQLRAHPRPSAAAFTLIELLISIAAIALLLCILLPTLGGARDSARPSLCSSNLRQLVLANDLYAQDHADRYAPGAADFSANLSRWHGTRRTAADPFKPDAGALTPYLSDDDAAHSSAVAIRACPTFVPTQLALASANIGFERSAGGYGYNNTFVGVDRCSSPGARDLWSVLTDRLGSPRSRFADPSRTLAFADAALADGNTVTGVIEYSFIEPRFWPDFDTPARPDPTNPFRHRAGSRGQTTASAAWLDGHSTPE